MTSGLLIIRPQGADIHACQEQSHDSQCLHLRVEGFLVVRLVLLLRTRDVVLFHHCAACGFFGGIGALLELLEAVFRGGARGFLRLLRLKGRGEKSEERKQEKEWFADGCDRFATSLW